MSSSRSGSTQDKQIAAVCLIVFATLLLGMVVLEAIMLNYLGEPSMAVDFETKANLGFVMPYFLAYLIIGGVGLVGVIGLVQTYGSGSSSKLVPDLVKLAALGYFVTFYWLWSAMWIVQHKITLMADVPTAAPEWVIREYTAADALWMLPAWGGLGPSIVLFGGLAWLLLRGARLLPRITAILFALLAISQLANLIYIGLRGFHGGGMFLWANDAVFTAARILAFVMAGAALYTERGLFARKASRTRVR
jgi:hypothetical protein